jgi:hypothetical protein
MALSEALRIVARRPDRLKLMRDGLSTVSFALARDTQSLQISTSHIMQKHLRV